ncbi:mannose-1-phosphate guanylyltransferase, partial [Anaerolineales bacterium HSG24]|nr:mannose-1-phosphate guanylyltransferase [Anaerolineales bacterium HSG24]
AGGSGTRLWPLSRRSSPKQLLPITDGETLVQKTVKRVLPITSIENIFFATNLAYGEIIKEQVAELLPRSIIAEPSGKNTAPCIGLAAMLMNQLDPDAVMVSLHSDHFIADEEGFRQSILAAAEVARQGYLVTLGITPNKPETGYGYIQRGESIGAYNNHNAYQVSKFLEKPNLETAQKFVASGDYYWNSGMFIWQISTLLEAFKEHMPTFYTQLEQMNEAVKANQPIDPIWEQIEPKSIDVGILEKVSKVAVIPVDFGWNDVGSWTSIHEINEKNEQDNVVLNAEHFNLDSQGLLIQGNNRLIATIGLEDVVIVDTDDGLLICKKDHSQDTKKVVEWLKANNRQELL